MLGMTGTAHATYNANDLIQIVYDINASSGAVSEGMTDLGAIANFESGGSDYGTAINTSLTGSGYAAGDTVAVEYFADNYTSSGQSNAFWSSGQGTAGAVETVSGVPTSSSNKILGELAKVDHLSNATIGSTTWEAGSTTTSYFYTVDNNSINTAGFFGGFYQAEDGYAVVTGSTNLATGTGTATQGMFDWTSPLTETVGATLGATFDLTTSLSGTTLTADSGPVPTAPLPRSLRARCFLARVFSA